MKGQKPRPDFPLFPHLNGQWAKKVNGRRYYFGSIRADPKGEAALRDWLARRDGILAGLDNLRVGSTGSGSTLLEIAIEFAAVIQDRLKAGKIADETFMDYQREVDAFLNVVGPNAIIKEIGPAHFTAYIRHLHDTRKLGPHRTGAAIRYVRAMFNWAAKNGKIPTPVYGSEFVPPNTDPETLSMQKARNGEAEDQPIFERAAIDWLLQRATPSFKAMILLSLNTGMGPSDIARLRWKNIKGCRLSLRRRKNGIKREAYIWKQTRDALEKVRTLKHCREALSRDHDDAVVFITRKGHPYVRRERVIKNDKIVKTKIKNAISITFGRWIAEAKIDGVLPVDQKITYYSLRHTFRTHADNCPDVNAVRRTMGRAIPGSDRKYIHGRLKIKRLKRVALIVKHCIWPVMRKPKRVRPVPIDAALKPGQMRLVS